jgi:linoleoyl-CoA desaturase
MKTIRFSSTKSSFSLALRKNVNTYFRENNISPKGNWQMVVKTISMYGFFLVPFILMLTVEMNPWFVIPLSIIMGIGMSGLGMSVMHDAIHGSYSRHVWLNKLMGNTMYLLGGNVFNWKVQHNILHHTFTNVEGYDEDIAGREMFRFTPHTPLKKIHRFQHLYAFFFYSLMTIAKLFRDFIQLREFNKAGITHQQQSTPGRELVVIIITKLIYFFIILGLPFIFSPLNAFAIVSGFFIMHLTAGLIMAIVFQLAHVVEGTEVPLPNEAGEIEKDWVIHELETTANFGRNNAILTWFVGGLNFQIEHHLFPNICHIHYKNLSPIVERTAQEFGVKYNIQPSFRRAVRSHLRTMKKLGR